KHPPPRKGRHRAEQEVRRSRLGRSHPCHLRTRRPDEEQGRQRRSAAFAEGSRAPRGLMIAVTGSDSPAANPAPSGEPDPSRDAARTETPFPRRRDLRNTDKPYSPDDPDFDPSPEAAESDAEPPPKDYGRAGRNLPAAIGMGLLIGGVVLCSLI